MTIEPKKEKMTNEQHQPVFEKMFISFNVGVNGCIGQHGAGI